MRMILLFAALALGACSTIEASGPASDGSRSVYVVVDGRPGPAIAQQQAEQRAVERMAQECGAARVEEIKRTWTSWNALLATFRCSR